MQTADPDRERVEQERARTDLSTRKGGPLGLIAVKEVHVAASVRGWQGFLRTRSDQTGPEIRVAHGERGVVTALVLSVASASRPRGFLQEVGSERILGGGVRIICTE